MLASILSDHQTATGRSGGGFVFGDGANPKALSVILGRSSIGITFDTYGAAESCGRCAPHAVLKAHVRARISLFISTISMR